MHDPMHSAEKRYYLSKYQTEISRYADQDGNLLLIVSHMPPLTVLREELLWPDKGSGLLDLLLVRDPDENEFWIVSHTREKNTLVSSGVASEAGRITRTYHPGNEWDAFCGFSDIEDLKAALGHKATRETRQQAYRALMDQVNVVIGDDWPYGSRPAYALADPAVHVYTREQYERACGVVDVLPLADEQCADGVRGPLAEGETVPMRMAASTLAARRASGIKAARKLRSTEGLAAVDALFGTGPYTRDEYVQASRLADLGALPDSACVMVVDNDLSRLTGGAVNVQAVLDDKVALKLAYRRVSGMQQEAAAAGRLCDECGGVIVGSAMGASLGLACGVDCYDAMADRPGRYASQNR